MSTLFKVSIEESSTAKNAGRSLLCLKITENFPLVCGQDVELYSGVMAIVLSNAVRPSRQGIDSLVIVCCRVICKDKAKMEEVVRLAKAAGWSESPDTMPRN